MATSDRSESHVRAFVGAGLAAASLGTLYAWSVLAGPISDALERGAEVALVFSVALAAFAVTVMLAGRFTDRVAPARLMLGATASVVLGLVLAAFAEHLVTLVAGYGVLFGAGNGLGYATAVAVANRGATQRRGLAVGSVVGAYAVSALVAAPLLEAGVRHAGWRAALLGLTVVVGIGLLIGAFLLTGVRVRSVRPEATTGLRPKAVLRSPEGRYLWAVFLLGSFAGLMTLSHVAVVAEVRGLTPADGATLVALVAIGNASGRVGVGAASDRFGRLAALSVATSVATGAAGLLAMLASPMVLYPAAVLLGVAYGALAGLVPAATADLFGTAHVGGNVAVMFSAWGLAGVLGPSVGAALIGSRTDDRAAWAVAATLALVGLVAAERLRRTCRPASSSPTSGRRVRKRDRGA
ncbi:MFS transporter [Egibacter rhizosphaerae]|nr:MFS transporter [Egibacter rhizosphaerae]